MMNSRRICQADGSQYKVSAAGLVFMESAAGLAMETSKVESVVRNQAEAKLNQLEHNSADALCVDNQSQDPVASYSGSSRKLCVSSRHGIQSQEADVVESYNPDARFQRSI
ncbi:hypothetical protein F511_03731 [Dorcoceras hygrometricum]|uniref:Uncharacterized protein n=1 Tax=Dorcoceras hygrometricum TaxID=472368 RepID=A0A2Z7B8B8_9LAMI|nr:hypothetical protein F511_03731 [Dorcoceras hygrometricum]